MTVKNIPGITRPVQAPEHDPSTLSNYHHFEMIDTDLNFDVDFDSQCITGDICLHVKVTRDCSAIVLDTSYLTIHDVKVNGTSKSFTLKERVPALGSALEIPCDCSIDLELSISIRFETTSQCTAIQYLDKDATDGKKFPYMFSQSEPIHSRSFFPCFDTPALKSPYKMSITSAFNSVMSGRPVSVTKYGDKSTYKYNQPVPIPSYLVAIASGDFEKLPVGPRSHVYCEPTNLKQCQREFDQDVEKFIKAAEEIVFQYEWDQYDILILPKAFPYGGMEIPNITFATPTIVTGDKSNIDVVAHELAHSWAGNLVTNCSWEHFWLNEGWCVYLERKILGKVHGPAFRDFCAIIGWYDMAKSIKAMGDNQDRFSSLYHDLKDGCDPDEAFSVVPYEKGSTLLYYLETLLTPEKFDPFIPYYFNKFKYRSLDSYQFLDTVYEYFSDDHELLDTVDWNTWIFQPGMPPIKPDFDTSLVNQVYELSDKWYNAITKKEDCHQFSAEDIKGFNANQSVVFLETLIAFNKNQGFDWTNQLPVLNVLDEIYGPTFGASANAEVLSRWYLLHVGGNNMKYFDILGNWLGSVGRMKFVRPGYVTLNKCDHDRAVAFFRKFESGYHPICQQMVKKDLGLD